MPPRPGNITPAGLKNDSSKPAAVLNTAFPVAAKPESDSDG